MGCLYCLLLQKGCFAVLLCSGGSRLVLLSAGESVGYLGSLLTLGSWAVVWDA